MPVFQVEEDELDKHLEGNWDNYKCSKVIAGTGPFQSIIEREEDEYQI